MNDVIHRIGVISDTHGLLRPEAVQALQGVAQILHAGDVGKPEILTALAGIAPVTAVRGNVDNGAWARDLPLTAVVQVGPVGIFMLHDLNELDIQPLAAGIQVVVSGHTHQAYNCVIADKIAERDRHRWELDPASSDDYKDRE